MCKTNHVGLPQVHDHAVHPIMDFVKGQLLGLAQLVVNLAQPAEMLAQLAVGLA